MGRLQATEMAATLPLDAALEQHLKYNHYPPINTVFIVIAKEAIEHVNNGRWEEKIEMPNGRVLTSGSIVEQLHLESFLDADEEG